MDNFRDLISELIVKAGGPGSLADEIGEGVDSSRITRFLSGEQGLMLFQIEKLLELANVRLIANGELNKLKDTIQLLGDLYAEEREKNKKG